MQDIIKSKLPMMKLHYGHLMLVNNNNQQLHFFDSFSRQKRVEKEMFSTSEFIKKLGFFIQNFFLSQLIC
jgi:hypothetical protein